MSQGNRLKKVRKELEKTGKDFVLKLSWGDSYQYQIEKVVEIPVKNLAEICEVYDVNPEYIISGNGKMFKNEKNGSGQIEDINALILNEVKELRKLIEEMKSHQKH